MKPYLTFLFLSLALSLMAQTGLDERPGAVGNPDDKYIKTYALPKQFMARNFTPSDKLHTTRLQNGTKLWQIDVAMRDSIPVVEVTGEWSMSISDDNTIILKPRGFSTLAAPIPALTPVMEKLKDAIENALGAEKIPDDRELMLRVLQKPEFEFTGSLVHVEGVLTRYFTYCDIVNLLTELDKK